MIHVFDNAINLRIFKVSIWLQEDLDFCIGHISMVVLVATVNYNRELFKL
jgi:hypothetical protein